MLTLASVNLLVGGPSWLAWIVLGAIAGFVTKKIMGGSEGFITETILGIIGAVLFSAVLSTVFSASLTFWPSLLVAIVGAVVVVLIWRAANNAMGRTTRV